jgi:hypothetical protein
LRYSGGVCSVARLPNTNFKGDIQIISTATPFLGGVCGQQTTSLALTAFLFSLSLVLDFRFCLYKFLN